MPSGLISMSLGSTEAKRILETSAGKGWVERPWKECAQSTVEELASGVGV